MWLLFIRLLTFFRLSNRVIQGPTDRKCPTLDLLNRRLTNAVRILYITFIRWVISFRFVCYIQVVSIWFLPKCATRHISNVCPCQWCTCSPLYSELVLSFFVYWFVFISCGHRYRVFFFFFFLPCSYRTWLTTVLHNILFFLASSNFNSLQSPS